MNISGGGVYCVGGSCDSQETGAEQGRETRAQLHAGHATYEEGVYWFIRTEITL